MSRPKKIQRTDKRKLRRERKNEVRSYERTPYREEESRPAINTAKLFHPSQVRARTAAQQEYIEAIEDGDIVYGLGPAGCGKAQPLDAIVYTPNGPVMMGNISVGDAVCSVDGREATVIGVFPQGVKQTYTVTLDDRSTVECCAEHLWQVRDHKTGRDVVLSTQEIAATLTYREDNRSRYSIRSSGVVSFDHRELAMDPYLMGVLLGDGGFTARCISLATMDEEILERATACVGDTYRFCYVGQCSYLLTQHRRGMGTNQYKKALVDYGLWGLKSHDKFIPDDYLYNTAESRLALLQGLMDTDGTVRNDGSSQSYCTTSPRLAESFKALVESLGGVCRTTKKSRHFTYNDERKRGKDAYECVIRLPSGMSAFHLSRKRDLYEGGYKYGTNRFIRSIQEAGETECQCIMIDDPSRLYLTDNFIVTHNTFIAVGKAVEALQNEDISRIILVRPNLGLGRTSGFLPGDLNAKMYHFLRPLFDEMERFYTRQQIEKMIRDGVIEPTALEYIRGRTYDDAYVILDEAQNATFEEMQAFLTRLGKSAKYIVTGDVSKREDGSLKQSDLAPRDQGALEYYADKFAHLPGIEAVTMTTVDIQRHPLVKLMLEEGL